MAKVIWKGWSKPSDEIPQAAGVVLGGNLRVMQLEGREAIRRLVGSCKSSDFANFGKALVAVDRLFVHGQAFLKLARLNPPSAKFRRWFRDWVWLRDGDHFRQEVGDDLLLCDVLRILMPPYRGPARKLYRGEIARNRRRRTYSISWTTSRKVAESFAQGIMRTCEGGSVVLETVAPTYAIVCKIPSSADLYGESEYVVDRRLLGSVRVSARYGQISHAEDEARRIADKAACK